MLVLVKGAGDLATGIVHRLRMSDFKVLMTEIEKPTVVRHEVAFATAVLKKKTKVEDMEVKLCTSLEEIDRALEEDGLALVVDPKAYIREELRPQVVVDAIIAKRNLGTSLDDADIVIGVGPGFEAGRDVDYVVETKRGHYLGKVLDQGQAIKNTSSPGAVEGFTRERIIRSPKAGLFRPHAKIGDLVKKGDIVAYLDDEPILAKLDGVVRGMLLGEMEVRENFKCGDIDPRAVVDHCFTISDKARAVGGGVLEAIMRGPR